MNGELPGDPHIAGGSSVDNDLRLLQVEEQLRRSEARLAAEQEQSRRLRELATLKADFTAMVAHELSAPIAAIGGLVRILASGKLAPEAQKEALAAIQAEIDVLSKLVADVRSAASAERDDFQVQLRPVPLSVLLADAAAFAETLPGGHPLATTGATDALVMADPQRIGQVLRNLLSNAAKYSPDGTPIELRAALYGKHVHIAVADHGPGIHPDDLPQIFEKFGRGSDQSGQKAAGVGLGLYLSRRIVQAHGSDLTVDSTPGRGSVFAFELEVAK